MFSKSDYVTYLKHPAWLWLKKHAKDKLPAIDANTQELFDQGYNFEPYAEKLFPDCVTLGWSPKDYGSYNKLVGKTQAEMDKGTKVIFQGRFASGNLTFICDVIEKTDDGSYNLYEIKATTGVRDEHLPDLSFQQTVMERLGYKINNIYVIHLDNEYIRKGSVDVKELCAITDVTEEIKALKPITEEKIEAALEVVESNTMPSLSPRYVGLGKKKDWMEVFRHLSPALPEYSIYDLAGRNGEVVAQMEDNNIVELADIPAETKITGVKAKNQLAITKSDSMIILKDKIKQFIDGLEFPLYFLDYESFKKAVPLYRGTHPYQQIVFQYSVHVLESPEAELKHHMYLHTEDSNPVEPLTRSLMEAIGPDGSVIVWHHVYERDRNREMGKHNPEYFKFYQDLNDRMVDLEIPFKKDWYVTKEFKGSSSIKAVLPVLVPSLSYKELDIQDGLTTGRIWAETVLKNGHKGQEQKMFEEMRKYNTLDTLAMVEIYYKLYNI